MGCGCPKRKKKVVRKLRERGHERTARAVEHLPTPEGVKKGLRRVIRGKKQETS